MIPRSLHAVPKGLPLLMDAVDTPSSTDLAGASQPNDALDLRVRDWTSIFARLDQRGVAVVDRVLSAKLCADLIAAYDDVDTFRKRVVMQSHRFGQGEYKYFAAPLPEPLATLRTELYACLQPLANEWMLRLRTDTRFPATLAAWSRACARTGQSLPTPLMLRYEAGDENFLHQDLYGPSVFPLQVSFLLNEPGVDFEGGEFVVVEQHPRRQSQVEVVPMQRGDMAVFSVDQRPVAGTRGYYRATMRHGVSRLRRGERHALGLIFHDAQT